MAFSSGRAVFTMSASEQQGLNRPSRGGWGGGGHPLDPQAPKATAILGEGPSELIPRPLATPVGLAWPHPRPLYPPWSLERPSLWEMD